MTVSVKVGGAWKTNPNGLLPRVSGAFKTCAGVWVKVSGAWKVVYAPTISATGTFTAGDDGIVVVSGWSTGGGFTGGAPVIGSLNSGTGFDQNGYVIDAILTDTSNNLYYELEGDRRGATFTKLNIDGTDYTRASALTPNGSYDAGTNCTVWTWLSTSLNFSAGLDYTYTLS